MPHIHILASNWLQRYDAEEALREDDYFLSVYSSAAHLDASVAHDEVDLLLIDPLIDEGSGLQYLRDMLIKYPRLNALVFIHEDNTEARRRADNFGARGTIPFPFTPEEIREAVRAHLPKTDLQRARDMFYRY